MRQLPPLATNLKKRSVKALQVYLRDSGLLHSLLQIGSLADLALEKAYLVYPGELSFPLRDGMEALGYAKIPDFRSP